MSATNTPLGASHALGLWNRHCSAMDELYDFYDPDGGEEEPDADAPLALVELWQDAERRDQLIKVFEQGERDRDRLLRTAYEALATAFGNPTSPFKLTRRKCHDPWMAGAYAEPRRKKLPQGRLWLTLSFDSVSTKEYLLVTTLWAKGGRKSAHVFRECLPGLVDPPRPVMENWSSGSAFLSCIALRDYVHTGDGAVDLDGVVDALKRDLAKYGFAHFEKLIEQLRAA